MNNLSRQQSTNALVLDTFALNKLLSINWLRPSLLAGSAAFALMCGYVQPADASAVYVPGSWYDSSAGSSGPCGGSGGSDGGSSYDSGGTGGDSFGGGGDGGSWSDWGGSDSWGSIPNDSGGAWGSGDFGGGSSSWDSSSDWGSGSFWDSSNGWDSIPNDSGGTWGSGDFGGGGSSSWGSSSDWGSGSSWGSSSDWGSDSSWGSSSDWSSSSSGDFGSSFGGTTSFDPINVTTGNKFTTERDYVGAGAFPLVFVRTYNSINLANDGAVPERIGASWREFYDRAVTPVSGQSVPSVRVNRPDGQSLGFTQSGGVWVALSDVAGRLTQLNNASGNPTGWKYVTGGDLVELYDVNGKLLSLTTRGGLTQTLNYDSSNRLSSVTDAVGRTLSLSYDSANRVNSMTDPSGGHYLYSYDVNNNLISVQYPDNTTRLYLYENSTFVHAMTGLVDQNGVRFATWTYDAQGRAISSRLAGGAQSGTLSYNAGSTIVTDALGATRTHYFQKIGSSYKNTGVTASCASCPTMSSTASYDANGYVSSRTDFNGHVTNYTYDSRGLLNSITQAAGTAAARTVNVSWHPTFHLPVQITTPTAVTNLSYDANGNLIQRSISASGQTRTWQYSYNAQGLVTQIDGPRTDVSDITNFTYDGQSNLVKVTNALNQSLNITSFDANGRPLSFTDANGLIVNLSYDARGRVIARSIGGETTTLTRNALGMVTKLQLPNGRARTYSYDGAHRLMSVSDDLGNHADFTRDAAANITMQNLYSASGNLLATRSYSYDPLSRLASSAHGNLQPTLLTHDNNGNVITVAAPLNRTTRLSYNTLDRVTSMTDPMGGITSASYDVNGLITQLVDPRNLATQYTRDGFGEVTQLISPDTGSTGVSYDVTGRVATATDARGITAVYTRDALNRVTQISYSGAIPKTIGIDDETASNGIDIAYDTAPNGIGRIAAIHDPSGSTQWSYDTHGRIVGKTQTVGSVALSLSYAYDNAGRMTSFTLPSGKAVQYSYASNGQLVSVAVNGQQLMNNVAYRAFGPVTAWTLPSLGSVVSRTFDTADRTSSYSRASAQRVLGYDQGDRLFSISDSADSSTNQTLSYDSLDRILSAAINGSTDSYSYDLLGNRLAKSSAQGNSTYHYAATSNTLTAIDNPNGTASLSYDAAGNLLSDGTRSFSYDARGHLVQAVTPAGTTSYLTNALGQRVSKSGASYYVYDNAGRMVGEYNRDGSLIQEYVYIAGRLAAILRESGTYYVYADQLGAPRHVTDSSGIAVWRWETEPFGTGAANEDPNGRGSNFTLNVRFPGQYYDKETGLHYNHFRYYDPGTGRYIESDPIGLGGGRNTYAYVGGNPMRFIDPAGLAEQTMGQSVAVSLGLTVGSAAILVLCPECELAALTVELGAQLLEGARLYYEGRQAITGHINACAVQ
jgi:RHS repeat-associated protein